jgi:pimeloyl-ACP methyl ester carboxylesterase
MSFDSNGVTLSGMLMFPAGDDRHPVVILLSGSVADTRDFYGRMSFAAGLAKEFGKLGYAVFSYDDRGVGKSDGDYWQATTEDHLSDVDAAILKLGAHPNVDSSEIGLLGHSFGAAIAPLVVLRHPEVRFSILLAPPTLDGAASKLDQVLFQMAAGGVDTATLGQTEALLALALPIVRDGGGYEGIRSALAQGGLGELSEGAIDQIISDLQSQFPPINPNTLSFLTHDPGLSLGEIDIPVLVVFGELDHQVPAESNHSALQAILSSRESHAFTVEVWPQANHVFQLAKTGGQAEWGSLEFKFAPGFLEFIGSWVAEIE